MKAAVVSKAGVEPVYGEFREPVASEGQGVLRVSAAALSNLTRSRAAGAHYSAEGQFPLVPGVDGVGVAENGRRMYFVMPESPFGAMAERTLVDLNRTIPLPAGLDDLTAAAIANPGMSCWAALVERARMQSDETVLINGATGASGSVAVQLARHLGASKIVVTGRNAAELEALRPLGADVVIPFDLVFGNRQGARDFEELLVAEFSSGIHVVIDYLWGTSARTIMAAVAKGVESTDPVRFIQVGEAGGEGSIDLPAAALRSSALQLMGSGLKSVPFSTLLDAIRHTFDLTAEGKLSLQTRAVPLEQVAETWNSPGKPRLVYTL